MRFHPVNEFCGKFRYNPPRHIHVTWLVYHFAPQHPAMSPFFNPPFIIAILIAISLHEWAHGFVAYKLGDPTAKEEGRLTINPIAHLDPLGALMFLFVGFGWAKPVPIDPRYFRHYKRDTTLVALAGPLINLALAFLAFFLLIALGSKEMDMEPRNLLEGIPNASPAMKVLFAILQSSVFINLALMSFNLLPIAPLDGSKVLHLFIPRAYEEAYRRFMRQGPYILLVLIISGMFLNIPILSTWVFSIMGFFLRMMEMIVGVVY